MTPSTPHHMAALLSPAQFQELVSFPSANFGVPVSERWHGLCNSLKDYAPPPAEFEISSDRKWELVSALQKSIRRGDKQIALGVIGVMNSIPQESPYFWRRFCVIACEDVGPADDVLATFAVACSVTFTPKKTGTANYGLWCFLAEQMCALMNRSRIYCSYAVVELAAKSAMLPPLRANEKEIVAAILGRSRAVSQPSSEWEQWQRRNNWRAAGLVKFIGLELMSERTADASSLPAHRMLDGLPSYSYDMYTRVGLEVLKRLVSGVPGAEGIRKFFRENPTKRAHIALGEAVFFAEGGRIQGELVYGPLSVLEQNIFSFQFGLGMSRWFELRQLAENALNDGVLDRVRSEVLASRHGRVSAINCTSQLQLEFEPPAEHSGRSP